jgi:ABC-2 type transport system permease protein/oleandomycin transport system permease protein
MFGAQSTAVGMAEDLHGGLIERFRSLVMARSAVLAGRVLADALLNVFGIVLMLGVGYLVGFRLHTNVAALVAATGVLLLFGFAISWVNVLLGMAAKSAEAAAAASLPLTVLLAFPSSAFLLTSNMPGPLRAYADHQPLTATVNTVRPLLLGGPTASHAVAAIIWYVGIVAVFAPLFGAQIPSGRLSFPSRSIRESALLGVRHPAINHTESAISTKGNWRMRS